MSLRALELNQFHLISSADDLKLSIISIADLRMKSSSLLSLNDDTLLKLLISGNIWVCRGKSCRFDIQISFNGNELHGKTRSRVLENLGSCLRDAPLWSQLSLSASLEICQPEDPGQPQPDMSICINHDVTASNSDPQSKIPLLNPIDAKSPESVLYVEFERLQIHLNFHTITEARPTKRTKTCPEDPEFADVMLLDPSLGAEENVCLEQLEAAVDALSRGLSKSIAASFRRPENRKLETSNQPIFTSRNKDNRKSGPNHFPTAATEKLKTWLERHLNNPYPTKEEKQQLMQQTRLTKSQVEDWLHNARRKAKFVVGPQGDEMLLSQTNENVHMEQNVEYSDDEDMLLSQLSQSTMNSPSLTSQSSITSKISTSSSHAPLKRTTSSNPIEIQPPLLTLSISAANRLASIATRLLITGCNTRTIRQMPGITIEQPPPETEKSLSRIVPTIFSPGFKELMGTNAPFLFTISHTISSSWVRNVQSPSLLKKLEALANQPSSPYADEHQADSGERESSVRIASVVQTRLWVMMQRKLYDPAAAKKLQHQTLSKMDNPVTDDEEDLLEGDMEEEKEIGFEDLLGRQLEEFEDLLLAEQEQGDKDDLLDSLEGRVRERERQEVEMETDEMLFGHAYDSEAEDEIILLEAEIETMLV